MLASAAYQGEQLDLVLDRDGCPWGWANSGFATSVGRYVGRRTRDDPRRAPTLRMEWLLRRAGDRPDRIFDAVQLVEAHEDGAWSLFRKACET